MPALIFITFLSAFTAFACPNLSGKYPVCRSTTGNHPGATDMDVKQSVMNRVNTYTVSATSNETQIRETEVYIADGKNRVQEFKDPESGALLQTSTLVSCQRNVLSIAIKIKLDGKDFGYSKVNVTKSGKQLFIDSKNFNGEEEISDREVCE